MAISICVAVPRMVPAYSSFSRWCKGHKPCANNVALTQSSRTSSPISFPQAKANPVALEIIRTISGKEDGEVQDELDKLQNVCLVLTGIFGDIISVLLATNPIFGLLYDVMVLNNRFLRWSSFWASYGALLVLKEFVKIFSKSQAIWGYNIIFGFLIYKTNMRNISLYKKGRHSVWFLPLFGLCFLYVLVFGKLVADWWVLLICSSRMPDIIWASIEIIVSLLIVRSVAAICDIFIPRR